jgi:hypothetical protein
MRLKAIWCCVKFGLLPWWCYEKQRHYDCSYWQHLAINAAYAWRWLIFQEDESDREFERTINGPRVNLKASAKAEGFSPIPRN